MCVIIRDSFDLSTNNWIDVRMQMCYQMFIFSCYILHQLFACTSFDGSKRICFIFFSFSIDGSLFKSSTIIIHFCLKLAFVSTASIKKTQYYTIHLPEEKKGKQRSIQSTRSIESVKTLSFFSFYLKFNGIQNVNH